jgi:hypothetical protein
MKIKINGRRVPFIHDIAKFLISIGQNQIPQADNAQQMFILVNNVNVGNQIDVSGFRTEFFQSFSGRG